MNGNKITCDNLQEYLARFSLVYACDTIKDGALRIATPFTYPNGSHIDLFVRPKQDLFDSVVLSDYGQTFDFLMEMGFNLWGTKKRREIVTDICKMLGVRYNANMFEIEITNTELFDLSNFIVRLAQACIRITDLSFTQRLQSYQTFENDVEEFLALSDLSYDVEPDLIGIFHKPVKVDFRVKGNRINSLVQTWSTRNLQTSHTSSSEIFIRWHDLQNHKQSYQFITVYDDNSPNMKNEDLARLYELSTVFGFPTQREEFRETLAA